MGLNSVYLSLEVTVSLHQVIVGESEVILLLSGDNQLVIGVSQSVLSLEHLGGEVSVSGILALSLSLKVSLLGELAVEVSLERLGLNHKSRVVILGSHELSLSVLKSLVSSSQLEVLGIGQFGEFVGLLLSFVEVVVDTLNFGVIILAFSLLESNAVSKSINLILILGFLLSELSQFVLEVIGVLSQTIGLVRLNGNLSLEGNALLLSSTNLVSDGSNLSLVFVVGPILLVQEESNVLDFFSERVDGDNVLVMSVVIVIILHKLLVLNVSVLLLDGVELVSESQVVLVSLLDFEDFGLQLRDQKVFLVACKMHGVVVLYQKNGYTICK